MVGRSVDNPRSEEPAQARSIAAGVVVVASFVALMIAAPSAAESAGPYSTTTQQPAPIFVNTSTDIQEALVEFSGTLFQDCLYWVDAAGSVQSFVDGFGSTSADCAILEIARSRPGKLDGSTEWASDAKRGLLNPGETVVAAPMTPTGAGMWIVTSADRVLPYGDVTFSGDLASHPDGQLATIAGATATADGDGFWLFDSEGNVRDFGSATNHGSLPPVLSLLGLSVPNAPIVDLVATPNGDGYVLIGADGGAFAFGGARFLGSVPGLLPPGFALNAPIVAAFAGNERINGKTHFGYTMLASDGGTFAFGTRYWGSLAGVDLPEPIVDGISPTFGNGHILTDGSGRIYPFGAVSLCLSRRVDCKTGLPNGRPSPLDPGPDPVPSARFLELEPLVQQTLVAGSPSVVLISLWCGSPTPRADPGDSFQCSVWVEEGHTRIEVAVDSDGSMSFIQLQPIIDLSAVEVEIATADPTLGVVECGEGFATARRLSPVLCTASASPGVELEIVPDGGSWTWAIVEIIDTTDLELNIEVDSIPTAGERLWVDVTVTNNSDKRVVWYGGGWDVPVRVSIGPAGDQQGADPATRFERPPEFDPDGLSVRGFLESDEEHRTPWVVFQPEAGVGFSRDGSATDDLITHLMEPGESTTTRLGALLRVGRDELSGEFVVTASFQPRSPYGEGGNAPLDLVTATSIIQIIDPPERLSSQQDALLALTAEPLVTKYIELTRLEDELPDTLKQTYTAEMSFAFGRWELWLEPHWAFSNPLRVVYDPATSSVVDVRVLRGNSSPSDDPDHRDGTIAGIGETILRD